jgi:hypothetical protein
VIILTTVKQHTRKYKKSGKVATVDQHHRRSQPKRGFKAPERYIPVQTAKGQVYLTERELKVAKQRTKKLKK